MSVKERLIKFIEFKKLSKSEFCRIIGVSTGFVSSMVTSIQPDKIERITLNFPELNIGWLLTGDGAMLKNEASDSKNVSSNENVEITKEAWEVIKKQSEALLIQSESNLSKDKQIDSLIELLKKDNAQTGDNAKCAAASGSDLEK